MSTSLPLWAGLLALAPLVAVDGLEDPPARALSRELCAAPRLAGTIGSEWGARLVRRHLESAGFEVEFDRREVLLSLPRRIEITAWDAGGERMRALGQTRRFDPDARPPGDVPPFNAWSASARARGPIVDVGRGLRADFERLAAEGVGVAGRVAIARYGGAYRGVKAQLAEEHGCIALLLYTDPAEDGAGAGPVWPAGPFKPGWDAQRGSISPMSTAPGDPSTPGWPSPAPGVEAERLSEELLQTRLPAIPVTPIGADLALALLGSEALASVELAVDQPRELRPIVNVIARLPGAGDGLVLAGNHRDAWVRGAQDAGSGTVSMLRAAQRLGQRVRDGWTPPSSIVLCFWDAEESGLIGSTEWGEANAELLRSRAIAYVNADAVISGLNVRLSGCAGLRAPIEAALARVPNPQDAAEHLGAAWAKSGGGLGLLGSGSDYTVFLHHLGIPCLDLSFGGVASGQYHTAFDDFALIDRFLDPDWLGHETAGQLLEELLIELADRGAGAWRPGLEARAMAVRARAQEWLGEERAERVGAALDALAERLESAAPEAGRELLRALAPPAGLPGRTWFKNALWAPGLETGYSAQVLPSLAYAAQESEAALEQATVALLARIEAFATEL